MIPKRVHIYMQDWLPCRDGSGTNNRMYSNVRAYLDLGFEVELICIQTKPDFEFKPDPTLDGVRWVHLDARTPKQNRLENGSSGRFLDEVLNHGAYWIGWPIDRSFDYYFKTRALIRAEILHREETTPGALHHFEYLSTACTASHLPRLRTVWSLHDIESNFLAGHLAMRQEISGREPRRWEARSLECVKLAERLSARQSRLVLCIARHECDLLRRQWACDHAAFFPMSLPVEEPPPRTRPWMDGRKLRLFHLGRIDSLPSFRSLQFILEKVFPLFNRQVLDAVEMVVVGEIRESERARTIRQLAARYPQVTFAGFQREIRPFYGSTDLQVVGSTEATGLRTRIVESFAYQVPVLSTGVGAEGVEGLEPGRNILLADDPAAFATEIEALIRQPSRLEEIAAAGRKTYSSLYSRGAVALRLQFLLSQYLAS